MAAEEFVGELAEIDVGEEIVDVVAASHSATATVVELRDRCSAAATNAGVSGIGDPDQDSGPAALRGTGPDVEWRRGRMSHRWSEEAVADRLFGNVSLTCHMENLPTAFERAGQLFVTGSRGSRRCYVVIGNEGPKQLIDEAAPTGGSLDDAAAGIHKLAPRTLAAAANVILLKSR